MPISNPDPKEVDAHFACIDLFSGCGGNSWGMLKGGVTHPLTPLLALDIDERALETYRYNMPGVDTWQVDIRQVKPADILRRIGLSKGELGCIVASPPCQSYSRVSRLTQDVDDYRNTLYASVIKIVRAVRPHTVFIENVPEMQTCHGGTFHHDFLERLRSLGYRVQFWIVNAADYGVPQHRYRLIYLAYCKKMRLIPRCPARSHGPEPHLKPWVTVADAIKDLPPRAQGQDEDSFVTRKEGPRRGDAYCCARHSSEGSTVFNHAARKLNDIQLRRIQCLKEGQAFDDLPDDLRPTKGYKASYGRMVGSRPAHTLTTYLAYPSTGRFSHYKQDRVITIREGLRLQSFDDHFRVLGNLAEQSTQVGNAVPPLLAAAFKDIIVKDLENAFGSMAKRITESEAEPTHSFC